jgi:hypothetical protein
MNLGHPLNAADAVSFRQHGTRQRLFLVYQFVRHIFLALS